MGFIYWMDTLVMIFLFPGEKFNWSSTSLQLHTVNTVTYTCNADLTKFPFDVQICKLWIFLNDVCNNITRVEKLRTYGVYRSQLLEYNVHNMTLTKEMNCMTNEKVVVLITEFHHQSGYYLLSIYIPTVLLVVLSYISFFFDADDFPSRINVPITVLLVLATFLSTASSSMARVSYLTFIDIWLTFCIAYVFVICVCHTMILFFRTPTTTIPETKEGVFWTRVNTLMTTNQLKASPDLETFIPHTDMICRIILLLFLLLFVIFYCIAGMNISTLHMSHEC